MTPRRQSGRRSGMTLLEVIILLAAMAMIVVVVLPEIARSRARPKFIGCVNNVKQVGLAFRLWAMDHHDQFPMGLAITNSGTSDHPRACEAWVHYECVSNELGTPKALVCPADTERTTAVAFGRGFGNSNLSYFVSLDAAETVPQTILLGDRNLTSNDIPVGAGIHTLGPGATNGWAGGIHQGCGNIGLADGSVQQMSSERLQQHLLHHPQTNRLAIP